MLYDSTYIIFKKRQSYRHDRLQLPGVGDREEVDYKEASWENFGGWWNCFNCSGWYMTIQLSKPMNCTLQRMNFTVYTLKN